MNDIIWGMRKETHRLLAIFRAVRGFKHRRTPPSTSPQSGFLRRHDPAIFRGTEVAQRVFGHPSSPLQVLFSQFSITRIQSLPEVGQPFEPFRTVLGNLLSPGRLKTRDSILDATNSVAGLASPRATASFALFPAS